MHAFLNMPLVDGGKITRKESLLHALGTAGQNISCGLVGSWLFFYCTDVLFLDSLILGTILAIARVWDTINDPLMGALIDRRRCKNGDKFTPYLRITPFFVGIAVMFMFINPGLQSQASKAAYVFIMYLLYDVSFTIQDISMWGVTSVMSPISHERDRQAQISRIGATIGAWLPGLIPVIIPIAQGLGVDDRVIFALCGLLFGVGGMSISIFSSKVKERVRPLLSSETSSIKTNLSLLFKNKIIMLILIGNILNGFALVVPTVYFFKYKVAVTVFGAQMDGLYIMFFWGILTGLPGTLAMLFVPAFAKKVGGMKNIFIIACITNVVMRLLAFAVGFQDWRILIVMIILAAAGIPNGMLGIAMTALWGDAIDLMEWKTGKRSEGVAFSAQIFASKISGALSTFVSGLLLKLMDYSAEAYEAGAPLSPTFDRWIWPLFIIGPAIGSLLYLIPLLFIKYPASLKAQVERELLERKGIATDGIIEMDIFVEDLSVDSLV